MRATAVARVPVLLLLPLFLYVATANSAVRLGPVEGDVGPDGVDLCVEDPLGQQELVEVGLADTCVRMNFCAGVGFDSMSQRVCAPID